MDTSSIDLQKIIDLVIEHAVSFAPKLALAIITLIVGLWLISLVGSAIDYLLEKRDFNISLRKWLSSVATVLLKACLFISVISMLGVKTTSFIAILGAAGLAVGLALQGSLSNFAGGVLILIFKPFKVGDYIVAQGEEGVVEAIDVFCTFLTTLDNRRIILPNGPLASEQVNNVTHEPIRRVDLSVGISYNNCVDEAEKALLNMAKNDDRILQEPAPFVGVVGYGDNSIDLTVWVWCKTDDYWNVYFATNRAIKPALDSANVAIPYPQRDVHIIDKTA
ncbi:mechanosensitive ion channel family protein [Pseudoalteromonas luteoviolacea]|uniref:Small-conductance mechanosensitive channel n=1 Tax=Pseudoalteromonas luteoviolacea H33 TaxID=1365251 RepID=A0A167FRJ3_9GAMM|nr:mechanosensitive ion channel domain-containing protein [Pseudoalteromonas luteoviolacea]KZN52702.1 mechanosensitive ion channel protein [Pseudoalteromonas luteoviolacea H33]KZN73832.1 mechanosensitive ion channel protein [Pseudoalteromonas luteoviolacea H33-S]